MLVPNVGLDIACPFWPAEVIPEIREKRVTFRCFKVVIMDSCEVVAMKIMFGGEEKILA